MSRWIEVEAFVADARRAGLDTAEKVLFALLHQPSIDLVRCGECRYYLYKQKNSPYERGRRYCNWGAIKATNPDDFCSYGVRKESE